MISMIAKMAWEKHKTQEAVSPSESYAEELRATGEDYLEAVLILDRQKGDVRCVDLATFLERCKADYYKYGYKTMRKRILSA